MFSLQFFHIPKLLSPAYGKKVCRALEKVVQISQEGTVNIIVVPPEEIAWMNEQYRGKIGPTDILTFSFIEKQNAKCKKQISCHPRARPEDPVGNDCNCGLDIRIKSEYDEMNVVGEIYLCLEKIQTYAKESGKTYKEQLEYIIIHGLVHLVGFDHETEKDSKKMEEVERKIQSLVIST